MLGPQERAQGAAARIKKDLPQARESGTTSLAPFAAPETGPSPLTAALPARERSRGPALPPDIAALLSDVHGPGTDAPFAPDAVNAALDPDDPILAGVVVPS